MFNNPDFGQERYPLTIDPRLIQALKNDDPAIRKKAIAALGKSQNNDAMPILAKVYKHDPDPEVREYARKAGIVLKKVIGSQINTSSENIAPHVQLAKEAVEHAIKHIEDGKNDKAVTTLRQAIAIDPSLRFDQQARQVIHQVIGEKDETHSLLKLVGKTFTMADDYSQFQSQYYREEQQLTYTDDVTRQMILRDIPPELVQLTVDVHDYKNPEDDGIQFIKTIKRGGRTQKAYVIAQSIDEGAWLIKNVWIEGEGDPVSAYNPQSKKQPKSFLGIFKRILGE